MNLWHYFWINFWQLRKSEYFLAVNSLKDGKYNEWVVPRENKIEAKGKGLLQTYWIAPEVDYSFTAKTLETGSQAASSVAPGRGNSIIDDDEDEVASLVP